MKRNQLSLQKEIIDAMTSLCYTNCVFWYVFFIWIATQGLYFSQTDSGIEFKIQTFSLLSTIGYYTLFGKYINLYSICSGNNNKKQFEDKSFIVPTFTQTLGYDHILWLSLVRNRVISRIPKPLAAVHHYPNLLSLSTSSTPFHP